MKPNELKALLPEVYRRASEPGSPLDALLRAMAALLGPDDAIIQRLPDCFHPYQTEDALLPFLARWVDLDRFLGQGTEPDFPPGLGRLRVLIAAAAHLSRWRGTAYGLQHFLELATGVPGFRIETSPPDAQGQPRPFHIRVHAPAAAQAYDPLIQQILRQEKPIYLTHELVYEQETTP